MKTLTQLTLASVILTAAMSAQAEWVSGHFRSNGTYVAPYCPSPLPSYGSYAPTTLPYIGGYATYTYSSTAYPSYSCSSYSYPSSYSVYGSSTQIGGTTFHNYYSSDGGSLSGTTLTIGNTSFTSLYGW